MKTYLYNFLSFFYFNDDMSVYKWDIFNFESSMPLICCPLEVNITGMSSVIHFHWYVDAQNFSEENRDGHLITRNVLREHVKLKRYDGVPFGISSESQTRWQSLTKYEVKGDPWKSR